MIQNIPKDLKGIIMIDLYDDQNRLVVPNALFTMEHTYKMIGVGAIPSENSFQKFSDIGNGIRIGMYNGTLYLLKTYPPLITCRGLFSTFLDQVKDGDVDHVVPYKMFGNGVEEKHWVEIPDADELVLLVPYTNVIRSNVGERTFFLVKKDLRLARIPMPNSFEDGAFCIGKGVQFDSTPRPDELMEAVYNSLMDDSYNMDLMSSRYESHKWKPAKGGRFLLTVPFDRCITVMNENIVNILLP